jgi:hypothetical protein
MKKLLTVIFIFSYVHSFGQVYSNKVVGEKNESESDSLKNTDYPYILPIFGQQATKAGFQLPYSAGLGINYLWQQSDLIIENLQVGFNNNGLRDMSQVIRFDNAVSEGSGLNFRPDVWLFPFLNVYGIFAKSNLSTTVDYGIFIPDTMGNWNNVISLNSKAEFNATTVGFGITPTIGVGGGWMALDMNFAWNDIPELNKPAFSYIFGPRLGKSFKLKRPESNVTIWVGGFRLKLNSGTEGSLPLNEMFDTQGLQTKVDNGLQHVNDGYQNVTTWWNNLSAVEQNNPVNVAKYEAANRALTAAGGFLNGIDESLKDEQTSSVQYALDKRPKDMWNFIVGSQYQYSKHFMLRFEYGFLGSRNQIIAGLQYRFGL